MDESDFVGLVLAIFIVVVCLWLGILIGEKSKEVEIYSNCRQYDKNLFVVKDREYLFTCHPANFVKEKS